jgi:hypothetical protein
MTLNVWDEAHWTVQGARLFMSRLVDAMPDYFAAPPRATAGP